MERRTIKEKQQIVESLPISPAVFLKVSQYRGVRQTFLPGKFVLKGRERRERNDRVKSVHSDVLVEGRVEDRVHVVCEFPHLIAKRDSNAVT